MQLDRVINRCIASQWISPDVDQILVSPIDGHRLPGLAGEFKLLGSLKIANKPADALQNVNGRIVILSRQLSSQDNMAVKNRPHSVADGIIHVVRLHQDGEQSGN